MDEISATRRRAFRSLRPWVVLSGDVDRDSGGMKGMRRRVVLLLAGEFPDAGVNGGGGDGAGVEEGEGNGGDEERPVDWVGVVGFVGVEGEGDIEEGFGGLGGGGGRGRGRGGWWVGWTCCWLA